MLSNQSTWSRVRVKGPGTITENEMAKPRNGKANSESTEHRTFPFVFFFFSGAGSGVQS